MKRNLQDVAARMERSRTEGAKPLWYMLFMDTMLDLLPQRGVFTHDELKAELEARLEAHREIDLMRIGYEEALKALDEHRPAKTDHG